MNYQPVRLDDRLLYFRALSLGLAGGRVSRAELARFIKDGADMAYVFARRYRTVVHLAELRQASECVLGVVNLGLVEICGDRPRPALEFLLRRGPVGAFQEGWSRLAALARPARRDGGTATVFQLESDLADTVSARPGRRWFGRDEYRRLLGEE